MIRMGWMTDRTRVIGSTSMLVNMWRIMRMPKHLKTVMEDEIYDARIFAAGPMMWGSVAGRADRVYAMSRASDFEPSAPNIVQCRDADALGREFATSDEKLLVIGGNGVFELMLPYATELHIAETDRTFPGNVRFETWERAEGFELVSEEKWTGGRTLRYQRPVEALDA